MQELGQVENISGVRRLSTIIAIDVCDYSKLSEQDEMAAIKATDHAYQLCLHLAQKFNGRVFKRIADGFLSEFPSTHNAVLFAIEYRAELNSQTGQTKSIPRVDIRIGVHVGDVIDRPDGDILGHGVNIAHRLQEQARRNDILVSSNVINLMPKNISFHIKPWGKLTLKNIERPIQTYVINAPELSLLQSIKAFFSTVFYAKIFSLTALLVMGGMAIWGSTHNPLDRILRQNNLVPIALSDNGASMKLSSQDVSAAYLRNLLESLRASNIQSDQAIYALLEQGQLNRAIEQLESSLDDLPASSPNALEVLHQLAALSYHNDPQQALHYYESILAMDENDRNALMWKFRTLNLLSRPLEAQKTYAQIIKRLSLSPKEHILITISHAYSFTNQRKADEAITILRSIEPEVVQYGDRRIYAYWQVEMALAYYVIGEFQQAEALLLIVIKTVEFLGADTNLSRAYSLRGLIYDRRAEKTPDKQTEYWQRAYDDYERSYKVAKKINKTNDMVEGIYSMASIDLKRGELKLAHTQFIKSLRLARRLNHHILLFHSLLGLAETSIAQNNPVQACGFKDEIDKIYTQHPKLMKLMGDHTKKRLNAIPCPSFQD